MSDAKISTKSHKLISQDKFVKKNGDCCPRCGSEDISWGSITIDGNEANQEAQCNKTRCSKRFYVIYKLTGYQIVD